MRIAAATTTAAATAGTAARTAISGRTASTSAATAAAAALAAFAALAAGCSASDEPAAPSSTTNPPAAAPRSATATATATTATTTAGAGTTAANQVIKVQVASGRVTPPPAPVGVKLGSTVVIEVTSDVADQIHVHGYEKILNLQPGTPGRLELAATTPGEFDVELEKEHRLLFTLRVG